MKPATKATRDELRRGSSIVPQGSPFDLRLSLAAAASFLPVGGPPPTVLRVPFGADPGSPIVEAWQPAGPHQAIHAAATPGLTSDELRTAVEWLTSGDLDLCPFYALAATHPVMHRITAALRGLKPLRPASLFEMALIAVTEQQLSLAAAFHIRSRIVERFGVIRDGLWFFPAPKRLAAVSLEDLQSCGLSRRKAEYTRELAERFASDALDFATFAGASDKVISDMFRGLRGFGDWSIQYVLNRGFGRLDSLPLADASLQLVVGHYLARKRLTAKGLERKLAPFRPFRGLAAYYLATYWRLQEEPQARAESRKRQRIRKRE